MLTAELAWHHQAGPVTADGMSVRASSGSLRGLTSRGVLTGLEAKPRACQLPQGCGQGEQHEAETRWHEADVGAEHGVQPFPVEQEEE